MQLVLSLFPGADLLGMAFEQEGFCIVRGPDLILGGDIRKWHCPAGKFDGIIGGPPCKLFSLAGVNSGNKPALDMIPEYVRILKEAEPKWWVMENVKQAYGPQFPNVNRVDFDAWEVGANQHRVRAFWSNLKLEIDKTGPRTSDPWPTVLASEHKFSLNPGTAKRRASRKVGRKMTIEEINEAMGLPLDFYTPCLNATSQYEVRGNGVPLAMGRAVAKAVKRALNNG